MANLNSKTAENTILGEEPIASSVNLEETILIMTTSKSYNITPVVMLVCHFNRTKTLSNHMVVRIGKYGLQIWIISLVTHTPIIVLSPHAP